MLIRADTIYIYTYTYNKETILPKKTRDDSVSDNYLVNLSFLLSLKKDHLNSPCLRMVSICLKKMTFDREIDIKRYYAYRTICMLGCVII